MGLKSRCWQSCVPSGGYKGESIPLLFPASEGYLHSLVHGHTAPTSDSVVTFLPLNPTLLLSFYRDPYDGIGPTWIIPGNLRGVVLRSLT